MLECNTSYETIDEAGEICTRALLSMMTRRVQRVRTPANFGDQWVSTVLKITDGTVLRRTMK
jgi:hypothetical protein